MDKFDERVATGKEVLEMFRDAPVIGRDVDVLLKNLSMMQEGIKFLEGFRKEDGSYEPADVPDRIEGLRVYIDKIKDRLGEVTARRTKYI